MLLTSNTDLLSLITAEACDVDVVVTYIDRDDTTGDVGAAARQVTHPITATTTTIVNPPGSGTQRKVETIVIRNAHATTSVDVTVQEDPDGDGSPLYEIHAARLYPTEMLEWNEQTGWKHRCRKEKPFFALRLADASAGRSSSVVSGSDVNVCRVGGTPMIVPPSSNNGGLTRKLATFCHYFGLAAATTTGLALGLIGDNGGGSQLWHAAFSNVTASVTASTQATVTGVGWDQLHTLGTSAVANLLGFTMDGMVYAESASPQQLERAFQLCVQSEVGASQVTINRGSSVSMFENTD